MSDGEQTTAKPRAVRSRIIRSVLEALRDLHAVGAITDEELAASLERINRQNGH